MCARSSALACVRLATNKLHRERTATHENAGVDACPADVSTAAGGWWLGDGWPKDWVWRLGIWMSVTEGVGERQGAGGAGGRLGALDRFAVAWLNSRDV